MFLVNAPASFKLDVPITKRDSPDAAVVAFAASSKALLEDCTPALEAAKEDRLSWIVYPKAGQLETDLNRDRLSRLVKPFGIDIVRLVSVDETWSAGRFRPIKPR